MNTAAIASKRELGERLRPLLDDLRFSWGRSVHRTDGIIAVSIDRVASEDGSPELLVTVFDGLPPSPAVHGLPWAIRRADTGVIVRVGSTDEGQFRLADLDPGEYRLEIDSLTPGALIESAAISGSHRCELSSTGHIAPTFARAQFADTRAVQEFTSDDPSQTIRRVRIAETRDGRLTLDAEVQFDSELWGAQRLARFRIWNDRSELLTQGYVGLYSLADGRAFGKLDLDGFAPNLRTWLPLRCYLRIDPQDPARLVLRDREDLERSLASTDDPRCREVLAGVLESFSTDEKASPSER